jgi:hypothetical protein
MDSVVLGSFSCLKEDGKPEHKDQVLAVNGHLKYESSMCEERQACFKPSRLDN